MITSKVYYSTNEIAELFSVTTQTVYNWRKQGLPYEKLGPRAVRFKIDEVTEWLKDCDTKNKTGQTEG